MFESNPDVSFGDVNLSEQSIRDAHHSPGKGGWPTIRYFNKETGYEGANYEKKTSDAMCTELGNMDYMQAYVEEAGGTSLCDVATKSGCSEKEAEYIDQWASKPQEEQQSQQERLVKMKGGKMKPSLLKWINQRLAVLKQLLAPVAAAAHSEL